MHVAMTSRDFEKLQASPGYRGVRFTFISAIAEVASCAYHGWGRGHPGGDHARRDGKKV